VGTAGLRQQRPPNAPARGVRAMVRKRRPQRASRYSLFPGKDKRTTATDESAQRRQVVSDSATRHNANGPLLEQTLRFMWGLQAFSSEGRDDNSPAFQGSES